MDDFKFTLEDERKDRDETEEGSPRKGFDQDHTAWLAGRIAKMYEDSLPGAQATPPSLQAVEGGRAPSEIGSPSLQFDASGFWSADGGMGFGGSFGSGFGGSVGGNF